jgi:formylglycine-generating enzyme required for sulfatase activity
MNIDIEWVKIPTGTFWMGTPLEEVERLEKKYPSKVFRLETPQREVHVRGFEISKYPITNEQLLVWARETGDQWYIINLSNPPNRPDHPAHFLRFDDAVDFCCWGGCRLPTEVEWEYAARGRESFTYPWGNEWRPDLCNSTEVPSSTPWRFTGISGGERDKTARR